MTRKDYGFSLNDEHEMIRKAARDFAQNEIAPIAAEFDESGEFPLETIKKMGEMGFTSPWRKSARRMPPTAPSCRSTIPSLISG